jgi:mono/diheme cytochrome c family protein
MRITIAIALISLCNAAWADPRSERLWKSKCAACHGDDGKGQTEQGKKMGIADMSAAAWQKGLTDDQVKTAMRDGVKRTKAGKPQEMDAFKDSLRPDQIDALLAVVRGFGK